MARLRLCYVRKQDLTAIQVGSLVDQIANKELAAEN